MAASVHFGHFDLAGPIADWLGLDYNSTEFGDAVKLEEYIDAILGVVAKYHGKCAVQLYNRRLDDAPTSPRP